MHAAEFNPHGHDSKPTGDPLHPFSDEELALFQKEDRTAGRAVITLMLAVFSLGLFGSIVITAVIAG
ncbi:MAG: hypothetical protein U0746_09000 [Gemmataceae bacterium]